MCLNVQKNIYQDTTSLFAYKYRLSSVVWSRYISKLATAKFEVSTSLLFRWLEGLMTSNLPTIETSRKTSIPKVGINSSSTKWYAYMFCIVTVVGEKKVLKSLY
jgi:hypothetical protein